MTTEGPELADSTFSRAAERFVIAVAALLLGGALGAFAVGEAASRDLEAAKAKAKACQDSKGVKP